ncbi:Ricin-type beta-trefoil lectin domain-like [Mucilaginibacter mallensis]|uniref:Ricin-type beta-trefoil lectin domain-like n=1 Tax=Mucilaginibacter mallensis TaxID=652787 RepID=A0A1H1SHE1_MUCMA|nr:RICIN domain-containing protein [Mucilaginibacter mallensis]SDS47351.1 Ricin-type beta-trefoil lectin domain-like [Mucilaginibacter mallensis]
MITQRKSHIINKNSLLLRLMLSVILSAGIFVTQVSAQTVDATTMTNKVMAGYQGWFRTPGDHDGNKGWAHLFNSAVPSPEKLGFDTWPDMSELSTGEKAAVPGFTYSDGSQAYLYSAQNPKTVLRHFQWMKTYGIDGVWLSEFCGHFPGGGGQRDSTAVLTIMRNVRRAATATGRTWAFMWDMSGFDGRMSKSDVYNIIINQWKKMVDEGVTSDPRYMHHNGKPVLLIWGFFPDRPASQPEYMNPVIDFLLAPGKYQATLIGGVDPNWRAQGTPEFQAMLMRMNGLQPWSVGRRIKDPATGYAVQNTSLWAGDIAKCKANNVIFMPVFNSGTHIAGPPPTPPAGPVVPRRTGNYLWEQFVAASKTGVINSAFVAMFDEINEGTQIMKIENNPPTQAPFLTYDGATSDYYLRLVGVGAKMLKEVKPISPIIPISPFDASKWYKITNRASGMGVTSTGSQITQAPDGMDNGMQWQLLYDGAGYFEIRNRATGKLLSSNSAVNNSPVTVTGNTNADNVKWHLEWDGTGYCRIRSKNGNMAISNNGSGTANSTLVQVTDDATDNLRWKITQQ